MKIICYGDSNTYGYDPRSYFGGRYDSDCRWTDILAAKTGWKVINQGENGREIPKVPVSFPADTDLLIVMLGTNDLLQASLPEAAAERMRRFLSGLNLKAANILLIAPPPMKPGEWVQNQQLLDDSILIAQCYQTVAHRCGVRFVSAGEWNIPIAFDGVHFTEEGHRAFAERLYTYLLTCDLSRPDERFS